MNTDQPIQKDFDQELHRQLRVYRDEQKLTLVDLAKQLDTNTTQLSKYLSCRPEGDVLKLENKIRDVLRNAETRKASRVTLYHNNVSHQIGGWLETIRKTNDVALIHGPAGRGKTCGLQLYIITHPTAVMITATRMRKSAHAISQLLFEAAKAGWPGNVNRVGWLQDKFRNSNRLVIIDNAHYLTRGACEFLMDFHDDTGVPIAFVGNAAILDTCRKSEQLHSRIGLMRETPPLKDPAKNVQQIVEQLWPEANGDLNHLGHVVIEQKGHSRALKKQVLLAKDIHENGAATGDRFTPVEAFTAAHKQLIRDYNLSTT